MTQTLTVKRLVAHAPLGRLSGQRLKSQRGGTASLAQPPQAGVAIARVPLNHEGDSPRPHGVSRSAGQSAKAHHQPLTARLGPHPVRPEPAPPCLHLGRQEPHAGRSTLS